ncbi:MAG: hypothetical protein AAFR96_10575 [Planctomycetota bacterium]
MSIAAVLVSSVLIYLVVGGALGLALLIRVPGRIDSRLPSTAWRVRLVLLPGMALLWPAMIARAKRAAS